jgi:hypothetical protein
MSVFRIHGGGAKNFVGRNDIQKIKPVKKHNLDVYRQIPHILLDYRPKRLLPTIRWLRQGPFHVRNKHCSKRIYQTKLQKGHKTITNRNKLDGCVGLFRET